MAVLIYNGPAIALGLVVIVTVVLPLVVVGNLIYRLFSDPGLPAHLPWAGVPEGGGRWAKAKATLSSFLHTKDLLNEGYAKVSPSRDGSAELLVRSRRSPAVARAQLTRKLQYSKKGQAYVLPQLLTGPEVILPMTQLRWLLDQPDTVLSQQEVNREFLEADHTFMHQNVVREPVHPQLIRRELTNKLGSFAEDIVDELHASLADNWGDEDDAEDQDGDGGWREVHVYNTMLDVISRLSTRVLVCRELCRNQEFLTAARSFDRNVVVSAAMINILPSWLKP